MIAPCKDCEQRDLGCHGRCEEYKEFKRKRQGQNDWLREQNQYVQVNRTKYDPNARKYRAPMRRGRT